MHLRKTFSQFSPQFKNSPTFNKKQQVFVFPKSDDLNSIYKPNFKKLKQLRSIYKIHNKIQQEQYIISDVFNLQKVQNAIRSTINNKQRKHQLCRLCQQIYPNQKIFAICSFCHENHRYCQNCLIQYINYKIGTMEIIRCPQENCYNTINKQCQIYKQLPEDLKKKYEKAQLWRQTINNPNLRLCPKQLCQGYIDLKSIPIQCNTCLIQYCTQCMLQKHQGKQCDKVFQQNHKQWKRCPNCRIFINKDLGCNHMICNCKYQFCFVCLQKFDSSHYECREQIQNFYCFQINNVRFPIVRLILMLLLFPILLLFGLLIIGLLFILAIPIGGIIGFFYTFPTCCRYLYCLVFIILPFGIVFGAIAGPIMFTYSVSFRIFLQFFRRYKLSIRILYQTLLNNNN